MNRGINGIQVGVINEEINSEVVDVEVREAVVKAISVTEGLGAEVEEISIPLTKHANVIAFPLEVESAFNHQHWIKTPPGGLRARHPGRTTRRPDNARSDLLQGSKTEKYSTAARFACLAEIRCVGVAYHGKTCSSDRGRTGNYR